MPLVAVLAGAALLDEEITLAVLAGGALVAAGVYVGALSRSPGRKSHLAPESPPA
jgi:drug/metabolite transporter (DMT)-like permease